MDEKFEADLLKKELYGLFKYIQRVREEIAAINQPAAPTLHFTSMSEHLDAIVKATEDATNTIMEAMEKNDEIVSKLKENITDEERVEGEPLAELAFSGFLALIQGLLLAQVMPDSLAPANPRPEIVEDVVKFLAERVVALQDEIGGAGEEDAEQGARDLALTDRLLDLVLFRLHGVDPADAEGFRDAARAS